jgi:hypothetical protein
MSRIRTLADLHESSPYAWPGGYPVAFYDRSGGILCYDCAESELFSAEEMSDDDFTYDDGLTFHAEVENGDQQFYGGVMCDGCNEYIVEAQCPECSDPLFDGTAILHADNVDASMIHRRCAAKMVCDGAAQRVPGQGVKIVPQHELEYGWNDGAPWFAKSGTIYAYR